jgi:hypothetical protein
MIIRIYLSLIFLLMCNICFAENTSVIKQTGQAWPNDLGQKTNGARGTLGANGKYRYGSDSAKAATPVQTSVVDEFLGNTKPCTETPLASDWGIHYPLYDSDGVDFNQAYFTYSGGCGDGKVTAVWTPTYSGNSCWGGKTSSNNFGTIFAYNFDENQSLQSGVCNITLIKAAASGFAEQRYSSDSLWLPSQAVCKNLMPQCSAGMRLMSSTEGFSGCNASSQMHNLAEGHLFYIQYSDGDLDTLSGIFTPNADVKDYDSNTIYDPDSTTKSPSQPYWVTQVYQMCTGN